MSTISVVISAFNEEKKLPAVLSSVSWVDEIIVIDNESTDLTVQIAKQHGAIVFTRANNPMLNVNKNYGFDQVHSEWILNLDGDEQVPDELADEIKRVIGSQSSHAGYWIPRKNIIFGKWIQHGLWWPDKQLRLFKKGQGKFPGKHIHEYISVTGTVGELQNPYIHHNYETISQFIRKLDTIYTNNEMQNLASKGYKFQWFDTLRMPVGDFVKVYFSQRGYKDGVHGLILALLQAFYSLVVVAKVWESEGFKDQDLPLSNIQKELSRAHKEVSYWEKTSQLQETNHPVTKLLIKLKRKYVANR